MLIFVLALAHSVFCVDVFATNQVTTVSFILDYKTSHTPNNEVILCDFTKVVKAACDHIFINSALWQAFLDALVQKRATFDVNAWQLYDTQLGLMYMRNRAAIEHDGIRYQDFRPIDNPLDDTVINTIINRNWTGDLDKIFDINAWQEYHAHHRHKNMIYMSGHGAQRSTAQEYASIGCGILSDHLIHVALFFNTHLSIDTFVISSCYWPATRLWNALYQAGVATVNYNLISPLLTEEILWLTSCIGCTCAKCTHNTPCFFLTCKTFTSLYISELTPVLQTILCSSDTVLENLNHLQNPTLILAGSSEIISIKP